MLRSGSEDGLIKFKFVENDHWEVLSELWDIELVSTPRQIKFINDHQLNINVILFLEPFYIASFANDGFARNRSLERGIGKSF
jgi:hypothetical protein